MYLYYYYQNPQCYLYFIQTTRKFSEKMHLFRKANLFDQGKTFFHKTRGFKLSEFGY